jgi:hypothetical protein
MCMSLCVHMNMHECIHTCTKVIHANSLHTRLESPVRNGVFYLLVQLRIRLVVPVGFEHWIPPEVCGLGYPFESNTKVHVSDNKRIVALLMRSLEQDQIRM